MVFCVCTRPLLAELSQARYLHLFLLLFTEEAEVAGKAKEQPAEHLGGVEDQFLMHKLRTNSLSLSLSLFPALH